MFHRIQGIRAHKEKAEDSKFNFCFQKVGEGTKVLDILTDRLSKKGSCMGCLERDVAVLLAGVALLLGAKKFEILADDATSLAGLDEVVQEAATSGGEGVSEDLVVLALLGGVIGRTAEDDLDGSLGTHDGNLGRGPSVVGVTTKMLGRHDVISTTIGLTGDDGDLGDGGLSVGVEELSTVANDAAVLLRAAREVAGNIDESEDGDVVAIAGSNEASGLHRSVNVEASSELLRLVRNNTDRAALETSKADDHVLGEGWHDLEEVAIIDEVVDDLVHIVREVRVERNQVVKGLFLAVAVIGSVALRGPLAVGKRQEIEKLSHLLQCDHIVGIRSVRNTRLGGVRNVSSKLVLGELFTSNSLHNLRSSNEEMG